MAQQGNLTHAGASSRIANAAPDGYTGTFCENIGYVSENARNPDPAQIIYNGWRNSSSHNACMHDTRMTVAGVGTYSDGELLWVTMEFAQVRGSTTTTKTPTPITVPVSTPKPQVAQSTDAPKAPAVEARPENYGDDPPGSTPTAAPTAEPTATPQPEGPRSSVLAEDAAASSSDPVLGPREYAALAALLLFAFGVLFLVRRRI